MGILMKPIHIIKVAGTGFSGFNFIIPTYVGSMYLVPQFNRHP